MLGCFALGSAFSGHLYPHYSFWRSGAAFCYIALIEGGLYCLGDISGIYPWVDTEVTIIVALSFGGGTVCAVSGWLGAFWKRSLIDFIRAEIDEFRESIGLQAKAKSASGNEAIQIDTVTPPIAESGLKLVAQPHIMPDIAANKKRYPTDDLLDTLAETEPVRETEQPPVTPADSREKNDNVKTPAK